MIERDKISKAILYIIKEAGNSLSYAEALQKLKEIRALNYSPKDITYEYPNANTDESNLSYSCWGVVA